jgi:4-amino-4-deoxy-L-arabinose transferase-like glycosyltransferase
LSASRPSPDAIERTAFVVLLAGLVGLFALIATLPAFPIDETRYLTVAWEMRANESWSLPTLNFASYSHKPPLLFWLINGAWSVFGLEVWPARLVGFLSMGAVVLLTHRLDRSLAPGGGTSPADSVLILLALPLFVVLGFAIMFDMLLTVTVMGGLLALWHAGRTGGRSAWLAFGLCIGMGLLAKGPIVLLHLLPPALFARYWIAQPQRKGWHLKSAAALALGAAIALTWAICASIQGGADYAEMLFWKQSAGRITSSFAHAQPFWFYIPIVLLFFFPVLPWRPVREALRSRLRALDDATRFLLSWLLPTFTGLSLISGKNVHYLLPLVPGLALLISLGLRGVAFQEKDRRSFRILAIASAVLLTLLVFVVRDRLPAREALSSALSDLNTPWTAASIIVATLLLFVLNRSLQQALIAVAMANLVLAANLAAQSQQTVARLYDLEPMSKVVADLGGAPLASTQRTFGEFGFLAKLRRPIITIPREQLPCWLAENPGGSALVRTRNLSEGGEAYRTIYSQKYRNRETFSIVQGNGAPAICPPTSVDGPSGDEE